MAWRASKPVDARSPPVAIDMDELLQTSCGFSSVRRWISADPISPEGVAPASSFPELSEGCRGFDFTHTSAQLARRIESGCRASTIERYVDYVDT